MMTTKFLSGSATRLILAIGSPSTSNKSASAPSSTTLGGGLVHQEAVFDTSHTGGNGSLNGRGRKGVHGDVSAPILGRFNRCPQFRLRESRHVDRAERRGNTAASRQLDLGGTLHELLADAEAHLVGTVGEPYCRQ